MDHIDVFSAEFWQKVTITGREASLLPGDLSPHTLGPWLGMVLWLALLALPLSGIQRADHITGATYVLYLVASGITLMILFGRPWMDQSMDPGVAPWILFFLTLSAWRWFPKKSVPSLTSGKEEVA